MVAFWSLPRLCEIKQNWGEWELSHTNINQDLRGERELALSLNSPPETWRYLCGRWQIMSHQRRLMGTKDILLAWVFEAHSAPISIAAVSPLIRHERWQICYESGLNTGLLWWISSCLWTGPAPEQRWLRDQAQSKSNPFKKNNINNDDLRCKLGLWGVWDNIGNLLARLWTDLLKMCWFYKCRGNTVRQSGPDQIRLALILRGTSHFKQASRKWRQLHAATRCGKRNLLWASHTVSHWLIWRP